MEKQPFIQESVKEMVLRKLKEHTNDDGNFIYPGKEDIKLRTGSTLHELMASAFGKPNATKPVDFDLFKNILTSVLKIPSHLLYSPPILWKKFDE